MKLIFLRQDRVLSHLSLTFDNVNMRDSIVWVDIFISAYDACEKGMEYALLHHLSAVPFLILFRFVYHGKIQTKR